MNLKRASRPGPLPPWLVIVIFLAVIGLSLWQTHNQRTVPDQQPAAGRSATEPETQEQGPDRRPIDAEISDEPDEESRSTQSPDAITPGASPQQARNRPALPNVAHAETTRFEDQVIRDQDGRVIFRGTIELQSTLDRIERGDRLAHRNDGSTFQNRERRLPNKPAGYYKEYVHPTRGVSGPGPQRVILGKLGEAWYTPDHYKTFRRIRS